MITARAWTAEHRDDLYPALNRLGLPEAAQERLLSKMPHLCVLLTGVGEREVRLFKGGGESLPAYLVGDWQRRPGTALLSGRREQFDRLLGEAAADSTLRELTRALDKLLEHLDGPPAFEVAGRRYPLGGAPYVMGVVNVTPDSFSDGGRFLDTDAAVAHGEALAAAGAHFLDVGGESTRPGARPVRADEELARVLPVLEALRRAVPLPLSIDTAKADVAREALKAGASLVNDVTGFHGDPALPEVTASAGAACCLMHIQGSPQTMQADPRYGDCVAEVSAFLSEGADRATAAGIPRSRILLDPGIGFGKTVGHNLFLLRRLRDFRALGFPVLVGTSRKSFLGKLTGGKAAQERLAATLGSVAAVAALGGADVIRVHDVAEARDAVAVAEAIRSAWDGGEAFGSSEGAPESLQS